VNGLILGCRTHQCALLRIHSSDDVKFILDPTVSERGEARMCVEGLVGAPRLSQSAQSTSHVISAHWTHWLFNWLHSACLHIAAGIQTRFLRLHYADPLLCAIWILNSSTSSTKTAV